MSEWQSLLPETTRTHHRQMSSSILPLFRLVYQLFVGMDALSIFDAQTCPRWAQLVSNGVLRKEKTSDTGLRVLESACCGRYGRLGGGWSLWMRSARDELNVRTIYQWAVSACRGSARVFKAELIRRAQLKHYGLWTARLECAARIWDPRCDFRHTLFSQLQDKPL